MTRRKASATEQLADRAKAELGTLVSPRIARSVLAESIARRFDSDLPQALLVIADLVASGHIADKSGRGHYEIVTHPRSGKWITSHWVLDELVEAAIAASPGLSAGYAYSETDLRTDLRDAVAGVLARIHPRPRFMRFRR